jgi:predicted transcriptional regulator
MAYNKRNYVEIIAEVLMSLNSGSLRKTHITFRCNLDSRAVSKYLNVLEEYGMIKKADDDKNFYEIQERGILFLKKWQQTLDLLTPINGSLEQESNNGYGVTQTRKTLIQ